MENTVTPQAVDQVKSSKKTLIILMIVLILLLSVGSLLTYRNLVDKQESGNDYKITQSSLKIDKLSDANNYFGINIFNKLAENNKNNLFISPLSLSMALTLTANGAQGDTRNEILKITGLENLSLDEINQEYRQLMSSLGETKIADRYFGGKAPEQPTFKIANSLWTDENYSFLPQFLKLSKDDYQASARSLDFNDRKSLETINNWVLNNTAGKIPKILNELKSQLYLVNAIYFKSAWENQFKKSLTKDEPFYLENGQKKNVWLMENSDHYNYYQDRNLQIVAIPYSGSKYQMVIFLPNKKTKINNFVESMSWDKYARQIEKLEYKEGVVKLPKFEINYGGSIVGDLQSLGLKQATSDKANFSNMSVESMRIGEVVHKTFIKTDEDGTEAAAATAIGMKATSAPGVIKPELFEIIADHPFFFTIEDSTTHSIIFMGTVKDPGNKGSQD